LSFNGGTLRSTASFNSARSVTLDAGGGIFDTQAGSVGLSGVVSGAGGLTKIGTGTLTLSGANTYSGGTAINAGALLVVGSIQSDIQINSTGTLGGSGLVRGSVVANSGGTVGVANPGDTLLVEGELIFAQGSSYRVGVAPDGNGGRVLVRGPRGTATIRGGTVDVQATGTAYSLSTQYTVLTAATEVTGTFGQVTSNLAFLTPSLAYDANNVYLTLRRNDVRFSDMASTGCQRAVAGVLTNIAFGNSGAGMENVLNTLTSLSGTQAQAALGSMCGGSLNGFANAPVQFMTGFHQVLMARLDLLASPTSPLSKGHAGRGFQVAALDSPSESPSIIEAARPAYQGQLQPRVERHGIWMRGFGSSSDTSGDSNVNGFATRGGGFSIGSDTEINSNLQLGLSAVTGSQSQTVDVSSDSGKARANAVALYGEYADGPWSARALVSAGRSDTRTSRNITVGATTSNATASYRSNQTSFYGEVARSMDYAIYRLEPMVGMGYVRVASPAYTEQGAGALNLSVDALTRESIKSYIGAKLNRVLNHGTLQLGGRLLWTHEFGNVDTLPLNVGFASAPSGGTFQVQGINTGRDGAILGMSLVGEPSKQVSVYVDYSAEIKHAQSSHLVTAGLRYVW
jgi:subtilase-type serine protease